MSITDELRKWAEEFWEFAYSKFGDQSELLAIADRIDAEHERECNEKYACGAEDGISLSIDALVIQTHGFIELPKDADGEYIHIGDVMAYADNTKPMEVVALVPPAVFLTEDGPRYADMCRHYHAPTVEDVLLEACKAYHSLMVEGMSDFAHDMPAPSEIIAEYAAKLRLAGDEA